MPDRNPSAAPAMTHGHAHASKLTVRACHDGLRWDFELHDGSGKTDEIIFSKDAHGMRKHDWHEVDFILDEPTGALAFHPDKATAIWIARGTPDAAPPCPNAPSSDGGVRPLSSADRLLRVRNDNAERCLLSFRLNFVAVGSGSDAIVAFLDPIMNNQNGGSN